MDIIPIGRRQDFAAVVPETRRLLLKAKEVDKLDGCEGGPVARFLGETIRKEHPRLVTRNLSGYGSTGAYRISCL
jgi:hypothetical protein